MFYCHVLSSHFVQLSYLFREEDDHALSKDVDVVLWQSYRAYQKQPPVTDAIDFVIVNNQLHSQFDEFKKTEIEPDISYLEMNHLLQHYCHIKPHLRAFLVTRYGKAYLKLTSSLVDELCSWIYKMIGQKDSHEASQQGIVINTADVLKVAIHVYRCMCLVS